jgi:peptidoglycan/xylan/chitin deacetylase (PgdA/CDA1 family)
MPPVDDRPDPEEVARRVRAAQAYAKLSREQLGAAIGKSGSVIDEITGKRARLRGASWEELRAIADRCGLPFEWFWADLDRLGAIAPDDRAPALFSRGRSAALEALDDAVAAAAGLRRRHARGSTR